MQLYLTTYFNFTLGNRYRRAVMLVGVKSPVYFPFYCFLLKFNTNSISNPKVMNLIETDTLII